MLLLMGAPKQKWTAEEEAALKAGVIKHGAGKWRTILKDPEFSGVLYMRSNVDLKVSTLSIPVRLMFDILRMSIMFGIYNSSFHQFLFKWKNQNFVRHYEHYVWSD